VALRDPPVLTVIAGHPFVAQRQGAGAPRVGRIVALHCPRDGPPQLVVLPTGKMRLQEFGDRQIGLHLAQGLVEPPGMRKRRLVGR
jgi:hypothetical protein